MADAVNDLFTVEEADEIIVDDKVAGYRLDDYFAWGGHQREFGRLGDEIHAETSRLYLRGKLQGAERVRVGNALAHPSRRKVELNPLLHFATDGFPREASWCKEWLAAQNGPDNLDDFEYSDEDERFAEAVFVRRAHSILLFNVMPRHVASLLVKVETRNVDYSPLGELVAQLSNISSTDLSLHPGHLFEASFSLIESHRKVFEAYIEHVTPAVYS